MKAIEVGDLEVWPVSDGGFRLDGGAMFGVVPKVLWERVKPADDKNRIQMATNCLLIRRGERLLLIDTGIGDKNDEIFRDRFGMEAGARRLPEDMERQGFALADVTDVLLTHLHFDHCGWNTRLDESGRLVPTFENARYWIERGEVEHARQPSERDRASYDGRNWEPLFEAGVVRLFDGEATPIPGVKALKAPGHNADMCIVLLDGGGKGRDAIFFADLVPTTAHLPGPWIMGYDLYPLETLANKKHWLREAAVGQWLAFFEHEDQTPLARVVEEKPGRFRAEPASEIAPLAVHQ
ncbi:MAG TPA: MBL fold metallo-hydrolase [Thermoanaerobaculia bacterium]|nr:MBL fold metallo-hydrolase [Thermoanaerobaculia bacterium]